MTLNEATERDYSESELIRLALATFPNVPEELIRAIFTHGYAMGSLHGFADARHTLEATIEEAITKGTHERLH